MPEDYEDYDSGEEEEGEAEVQEESDDAEESNVDAQLPAAAVASNDKTETETTADGVTSSLSGKQPPTSPQKEPPSLPLPQSDNVPLEKLVQHLQVTTLEPGKGKNDDEKAIPVQVEEGKKESKGKWLGVW
ncbi:hypothetical protein QFC22_003967 [Naganishia vaughanmartiniae]|uniref:Uncharacterized protein n=1 Tax=Naganishia vaughanmartiniae TaxID=1424756 RepID=A0ACC2X511_9TREE|nr:hypothetical protein QFC22_003967 [Naganishia vaughanmartiniae]